MALPTLGFLHGSTVKVLRYKLTLPASLTADIRIQRLRQPAAAPSIMTQLGLMEALAASFPTM